MGEVAEARHDEAGRVRPFLPWAIASMVLCFLPLGVVSVVCAVRSDQAAAAGDVIRAAGLRRAAKRWAIAALVVGLVIDLVLLAFLLLLGAFGR